MKHVFTFLFLWVCLLWVSMVFAQQTTLSWDKNLETDMKDYGVYMCFTPQCVVTKTPTMLQSYVTHPTTTFALLPLKEGTAAVSARDVTGNESALSVSVPFDLAPPKIPVNPKLSP